MRLRDENRLLEAVLGVVDAGVVAFSSDGSVTHASVRAVELLGRAVAVGAAPGKWIEHLRPRTPEGLALSLVDLPQVRALRGQDVDGISLLVETAGAEMLLTATGEAVEDVAGRVLGAVLVFEDVTEQQTRELMLRHATRGSSRANNTDHEPEPAAIGLAVFSQPIVDVASGERILEEITAAGAQSRKPIGHVGRPSATGRIRPAMPALDMSILGQAVQIAARERRVLMGVSALAVARPATPQAIKRALEVGGIDPSLIIVQITETTVLANLDAARRFAEQLTDIGCDLALKGFGSGQTASLYLQQIPLKYLRFDAPRESQSQDGTAALVDAIVRLAHRFGLRTVGGDVDDAATLARLREAGVDLVQGRLFGEPRRVAAARDR